MFPLGRRLALGCVAVVLALTGCGGGGSKPVSLPSISPSVSPSASPTSTATELDAVSAVVRRYFALINGPTTTAAANELASIMTRACKCRRVATSVRGAAARHRTYFGKATITSFVPNIDGPADADVLVDYDSTASGMRDAQGNVLHRERPMKDMSADFRLVREGDKWLIDIVQIIREGQPA